MTSTAQFYADPQLRPKLDPSLYSLQNDELAFFRQLTGIEDEDELRSHILAIQAKAYDVSMRRFYSLPIILDVFLQVYGYGCIKSFAFTKYISRNSFQYVEKHYLNSSFPFLSQIENCEDTTRVQQSFEITPRTKESDIARYWVLL